MKIKVTKNGPFIVTGDAPLRRKKIVEEDGLMALKDLGPIETPKGSYALCRCGKSQNPPFCDATHAKINFDGTETIGHGKYLDRASVLHGPEMDLLDDDRCAYARFCHKHKGDVWNMTLNSDDPQSKTQAVQAASQCPTGRLTAVLNGAMVEGDTAPCISIVDDEPMGVSAGIFVVGGIEVEDAEGKVYETRNRQALCRCGNSGRKPFCDATHVSAKFHDNLKRKSGPKK